MDEEEECPQAALDQFLTEWRRELLVSGSRPREGVLGKRGEHHPSHRAGDEGRGDETEEEPAGKRLAPREPSPLLVLPAGRRKEEKEEPPPPAEGEGSSRRGSGSGLLDTLIADLDEINTIPFFEVQLPREVALVIFSYLSPADICSCARVSRSWLSLAEDNILWCQVCHRMGYETNVDVHGHIVWKAVVKEIVLRKKKELRNWKERICGLSEHQPEAEGVLLCVDYCPLYQQLLACYSSGAVFLWSLASEDGPVNCQRGHTHMATPILCKVRQGWAAVASEQGTLELYDCSTGSVAHQLPGLAHMACMDLQWREDCVTIAAASNRQLYQPGVAAPLWYSDVTVLSCHRGGGWETVTLQPPQGHGSSIINQLALLPPSSSSPFPLLYSTQTTLTLHQHPSPPTHILTSAGTAGSTVINQFDHTPHSVACGTSAWGYHIQLYDLQTGAHQASLRGHGQPVTALNIHSSPANMLVSGSADRRVRVFDCRCSQPSLTLRGHSGTVISVQCDKWRVVSGGKDGMVIVWDQRMAGELWSTHERHPVAGCWFDSRYLVAAHIPERRLQLSPAELSRRQRGLLRVMDFTVDPLYYTRMLPSVCSSGYDEPSRSLHHLDLKLPYDIIS